MNRGSCFDARYPNDDSHFRGGETPPQIEAVKLRFGARSGIRPKSILINQIISSSYGDAVIPSLARGLHLLRAETEGGIEMKKEVKDTAVMEGGMQAISIIPLDVDCKSEEDRRALLELQLMMATSSINHEYARMEFDDTENVERKEELLEFMNECRAQYFEARQDLASYNPYSLVDFEQDLMHQKQMMLAHYNA